MKYVVILPDGAHDEPCAELDGQTPLERARIPHMDWVATHGVLGRAVTVPAGFTAGTDVGTLTLLGYDPKVAHTGHGPIEAAARRLKVRDDQLIFRCNFVTLEDGRMADFTAGHISQRDADQLVNDLNEVLERDGCQLFSGVSYRNLMLLDGAAGYKLSCVPPHDIPGQPVAAHLPKGSAADRVRRIMTKAAGFLITHPSNRARLARGEKAATDIWLWGQGRPMALEGFARRWKLQGAVISAVDVIRGLAVATGMKQILAPSAAADTDLDARGRGALEALADHDIVFVHVEAADKAAHLGDAREKVRALERIDEAVVGPLLEALRKQPPWRILVAVDHSTSSTTRVHSPTPPLFAYAGSDVPMAPGSHDRFTEKVAESTGLLVDPGHTLMGTFLQR